jgi:hypothetical protein
MQLTLIQLGEFREALKSVFSLSDFELMLKDRLGKNIEDFTPPARRDLAFSSVLEEANDEEWIIDLAIAVRAARPKSLQLRRILEEFGVLTAIPAGPELERIVVESNSLLNIHDWSSKLIDVEGRVCRITDGEGGSAQPLGSGFLVGRSTVITNQHVIASYESGSRDPKRLRAQFDHYVLRDGSTRAGTFIAMQPQWLLASSPPSDLDHVAHPIEDEPAAGELDYALLRLDRAVGAEPIPPAIQGADLPNRGWIDLTKYPPNASPDRAVFIAQHPDGSPMKLALETKSLIGYSPRERRVRYRTNTKGGSSGSPAFDQNWKILALHHAGDPNFVSLAEYNEGIPIRTIVEHLDQKGVLLKLND